MSVERAKVCPFAEDCVCLKERCPVWEMSMNRCAVLGISEELRELKDFFFQFFNTTFVQVMQRLR